MGTTPQIEQFVSWMKSLKHIPVKVIVAGNHEVILDKPFYEDKWHHFHRTKEDHQVALEKLESAGHGIVYLDNSSFQVDGAKILHKKWQKHLKQKQKQESLQGGNEEGTTTLTGDDENDDDNDNNDDVGSTTAAQDGNDNVVAGTDPREGWKQGYKIWASPWQPEFFDWAFNEKRGKLKGNTQSGLSC